MASEEFNENKSPLNLVAYPARDFNTNFDFVQRRLREMYGTVYNDFVRSSEGIMLVHLFSYGFAQLNWYLARQASDTYLSTARTNSAVAKIAGQLGYKVRGASASSGDLTLTFAATAVDANIPQGFKFAGPRGLTLEATANVFVPAGSTTATVNVTEGIAKERSFTSDGSVNQEFVLTGANDTTFVAFGNVRLFVNGAEWTENDFLTFDQTDQFEVDYTVAPPVVRTGDGFAGNIPASGVEVVARYRLVSGELGSIQQSGADELITATDPFLVDGTAVPVVTTAPNGVNGGSNPESLVSVKRSAAGYFGARGVTVTVEDYKSLVNAFTDPTFGAVAQGYAAVVRETGNDFETTARTNSIVSSSGTLSGDLAAKQIAVDGLQATATTGATDANTAAADVETANTAIAASGTVVSGEAASVNNQGAIIEANIARIESLIVDLTALIDTSAATAVQKDGMKGVVNQIEDLLTGTNSISLATSSVKASAGTLTSEAQSISSQSTAITTALASLSTALTSVTTSVASIGVEVADISSLAAASDTSINTDVTALLLHLGVLFDDGCRSNVVNVPILTKNSDGFYTGPSSGLIAAVQTYLDGIKEVTQQVNVVSGAPALIPAEIQVKVGLESSLVESDVFAAIEAAIDVILKDRAFNVPLKLSDIYDIVDVTSGVTFSNILITGPTDRLDPDGNLVPGELEIVTKGSITVSKAA